MKKLQLGAKMYLEFQTIKTRSETCIKDSMTDGRTVFQGLTLVARP